MSLSSAIRWDEVYRQLAETERRLELALHPTPDAARAILAKRAAAVRDNLAARKVSKTEQWLVARAGSEYLALPLPALAEVLPVKRCTPVPGAPPEVLGIVNVRGDLHSVIDARWAFGTAGSEPLELHYGLVLRHPVHRVILAVSAVLEIYAAPSKQAGVDDEMLTVRGQMARRVDIPPLLHRLLATSSTPPLLPSL